MTAPPRVAVEGLQEFDYFGRCEVVQEQRGGDVIGGGQCEGLAQRVGLYEADLGEPGGHTPGDVEMPAHQVDREDPHRPAAGAPPAHHGDRQIGRAGAHVQHRHGSGAGTLQPRKQVARQRAHTAQVAVDPAQVGQALGRLGGGPAAQVQHLNLVDALGYPHALMVPGTEALFNPARTTGARLSYLCLTTVCDLIVEIAAAPTASIHHIACTKLDS